MAKKQSYITLELADLEKQYKRWYDYVKSVDPSSSVLTVQEKKFAAELLSKTLPEMLEALNRLRALAASTTPIAARGETRINLIDQE